jgi:uncharacterized membrane protein HdeD (DUF308 family)
MEAEIREHLGRSWGWMVLRGVAALLFGVFAVARPGMTLAVLVITWGAYAIVDGLLAIVAGFQIRDRGRPLWSLFIAGALGIVAGGLTFRAPELTALALLMVMAGWAIGVGVLQIIAAIRLRKVIEGEWALGLSGVLSVVFGAFAILHPGAGALAVVWMIAAHAIGFGALLVLLGLRLRALGTPPKLARA